MKLYDREKVPLRITVELQDFKKLNCLIAQWKYAPPTKNLKPPWRKWSALDYRKNVALWSKSSLFLYIS